MGDLPAFMTYILPSFAVTGMDLLGPQEIKDDIIKRGPKRTKKVWIVIFTCLSTRAVHLDIAADYSTESILHCIRRLLAIRGDVQKIVSDPGTQLIGASKDVANWRDGWDTDKLVRFGATRNLEWIFVMADSQHQNGGIYCETS